MFRSQESQVSIWQDNLPFPPESIFQYVFILL